VRCDVNELKGCHECSSEPDTCPASRAGSIPLRQADSGAAPAGFADVVAALNRIADDHPEASPHWSVTFAVDDADAIARRDLSLGGRVEVPPFDAPWVRMTVITDPQGATFTASKFTPENT
jgi:uncharacterized protein